MAAKPKAQLMKDSRKRKAELGLIRREYWATKKNHEKLKIKLDQLTTNGEWNGRRLRANKCDDI